MNGLLPEINSNSRSTGWGEGREYGGWREHGISRGIEERACGNSRSQLKKKWNFQGCSRKTDSGISLSLGFWRWNFQNGYRPHNLQNFQRWKLVFFRISKDKVTNLKIPGFFFIKVYPQPPLFGFFWNSPPMACWLTVIVFIT